MTDDIVPQLPARFDELSQRMPDDGIEFWFARDLMVPLDYARWENFTTAIQRGIKPERLPAEEYIKRLERRVKSDEKRLEKQSGKLPKKDHEI